MRDNKTPVGQSSGLLEALTRLLSNSDAEYSIAPLWNASTQSIAIIIPGVVLRDGKLEEER
jgi:hypothetical protein